MQGNKVVLEGNTLEEKMDHVERLLGIFSRKLGNKVIGLIPPIPVFATVGLPDKHGCIYKSIMPLDGKLDIITLYVGQFEENARISIKLQSGVNQDSRLIKCSEDFFAVKLNWDVVIGDILSVHAESSGKMQDIMLGILLLPHMSTYQKEIQSLDRILKLEESENARNNI